VTVETRRWAGLDSEVPRHVAKVSEANLRAYAAQPLLVREHAQIELHTAQGGYGRRQIYELIQNGADELIDIGHGRIQVVLTGDHLYCANEGDALDIDGVESLLTSHISMKRSSEIGRFGLGFKSVLGVSDRPEVFSATGSFKFDPLIAQARIREVVPDAQTTPALRFGIPVDPYEAAAVDPILADMMTWASTVIRLRRTRAETVWLSGDLHDFPAEFLVFSPHVSLLILEDRVTGLSRDIRLEVSDHTYRIIEGATQSTWKVFEKRYSPSPTARAEGGELANREQLPLIWAVPVEGRTRPGEFWAFFPTTMGTTLSGILNAPWKTNEDRQNLLTGIFNDELIDAAAELVIDSLPDLVDADDPAKYIDLLPARGRETRGWADTRLTAKVYELGQARPSIPDQLGRLRPPGYLKLHPADIPRHILDLWSSNTARPVDWCHPSVETRERRPRVERLMQGTFFHETVAQWLKAIVGDATPDQSKAALHVAAELVRSSDKDHEWLSEVAKASIVLAADERLVPARSGQVFLPGAYSANPNIVLVHPQLSSDEVCRNDLETLQIRPVEPEAELEAILQSPGRTWSDLDWEMFWKLTRNVGQPAGHVISTAIDKNGVRVCVRTRAGTFRPLLSTLLPGEVIPADATRDADVLIDVGYHDADLDLLARLGASSVPSVAGGKENEQWFPEYNSYCVALYEEHLRREGVHARPQTGYLMFEESEFVGPLEPMTLLTPEGRARFTSSVLAADSAPAAWTMTHRTMDRYPKVSCPSPNLWMVVEKGRLRTSLGIKPIGECVGPGLAGLASILPVAECSDVVADTLELPNTVAAIDAERWTEALTQADGIEDERVVGALYAAACGSVPPPDRVWCRLGGDRGWAQPRDVVPVSSIAERDALAAQRIPTLLIADDDSVRHLIDRWGLKPAAESVRRELAWVPASEDRPLIDMYPGLRLYLPDDAHSLVLRPCSALRYDTFTSAGRRSDDLPYVHEKEVIYWLAAQDDKSLLWRLDKEFGLKLTPEDVDDLVQQKADAQVREQLDDIRSLPTLEEKLLAMVDRSALAPLLPQALIRSAHRMKGNLDDRGIAELVLAVYGVDTLRKLRQELEAAKLPAPKQWAGSMAARTFVRSLGFPPEFAGFDQTRLEELLEILGPPDLPPMHDFQKEIAVRVRALLRGEDGMRAMVSLPTGAGKTRVAVEAIVDAMRDELFPSPILWIAQSGELCEQAVQTWSYVWRAKGSRGLMSISRLWATNEAEPVKDGAHVVVATIQKLKNCISDPRYDWLSQATCVVIDEAHAAITPSYTEALAWLGMDARTDRCPILGLSATPFRGTNDEESRRLARRFGERRLDLEVLGDDPYGVLQDTGVLARVRHEVIKGADVNLTPQQLAQLQQTRLVPAEAEEQLGSDVTRNLALLERVSHEAANTTVLLFAVSVDHAQTMAALLRLNGVPAAAISEATDDGARRHYIEEFRRGRIRVLTNFNVLTQGFDAPAVGAIFVARPTFSRNLYQQMIGRGLRGPKNGGKDECLIVNVEDNFLQYKEELAFYGFDHLWKRS
jgi:superfamily II DNA or RNA helicase